MNIILVLLIIVSIIEYYGDSQLKIFARQNTTSSLVYGILVYAIVTGILVYLLKYGNLMYVNGLWAGISALIETILAFIILHETLDNNVQYIGLLFIIMGVVAMNYGGIPK